MAKRVVLEANVRVAERGRIAIPAAMRKALGVITGDVLFLKCAQKGLHVQTRMQRIAEAQAIVRRYIPADVSLVDELIAERRANARRARALGR